MVGPIRSVSYVYYVYIIIMPIMQFPVMAQRIYIFQFTQVLAFSIHIYKCTKTHPQTKGQLISLFETHSM